MPPHHQTLLVVITTLDFGGAETQVLELSKRFRAIGWTVSVVVLAPPMRFVQELESNSVCVHSLDMKPRRLSPRNIAHFRRVIADHEPHVVHSHMFHANIFTRMVRPTIEMPVLISTAHSISEGGPLRSLAYRLTDRFADVTTNVSQAAVDRYVDNGIAPRSRIRHIPNGIDTNRFCPDQAARRRARGELGLDDHFVFLCVGRFIDEKGHESLVRSFVRTRTDTTLLLLGDGPERSHIEARVREFGLDDQIRFLGIRRDVPDLMNAADAYVTASEREGLPMVLLEASSTGLPIVATDVGGTREIVEHERTGLLVQPSDEEALTHAMQRMREMPQPERRTMGARGRQRTSKLYSLDVVVDQWEALYEELLQRRRGVGRRWSSTER